MGCEQLEARIVLDAGGFPGNDCPPDLDLSSIGVQTATVGQPFTLDLTAAGATIVDRTSSGGLTGDELVFLLDPDVPGDTPIGASMTNQGLFTWTPTAGQEGSHSIVVILVDEGAPALADAETFEILVEAAPNAAPVVDLNGSANGTTFSATFTEGGGPVAIVAVDATITDVDSSELTSATISLMTIFDGADEMLSVDTSGTSIVASYDTTTGILSLTGIASITEYEAVLRTLTYDNTSDSPDIVTRQVDVTVSDGMANSATVSATIEMIAVNDAPNLEPIPDMTAVAGTEIEVTVTASDPDAGDTLTFFLDPETAPFEATIEQINNNTAIVRWTPQASVGPGPHNFIVLVSDSASPAGVDSEQFSVTVNVAAAVTDLNGAADGLDFAVTFVEGADPVLIADSGATITDSDGTELTSLTATITNLLDGADESLSVDTAGTTIAASYDPATGTLTLTGIASLADYEMVLRTIRYHNSSETPDTTSRTITVAADDGNGIGNPATTVVTIDAVNDAPDLTLPAPYNDSATAVQVNNGETITFTAMATDVDDDASALTFMLDLDGSGIPDGESLPTIDSATGEFTWTTSITGCFSITVIVTDAGGMADQETFLVLVESTPLGAPPAPSGNVVDVEPQPNASNTNRPPQDPVNVTTADQPIENLIEAPISSAGVTDRFFAALGTVGAVKMISTHQVERDDLAVQAAEFRRVANAEVMRATYAVPESRIIARARDDGIDHDVEDEDMRLSKGNVR